MNEQLIHMAQPHVLHNYQNTLLWPHPPPPPLPPDNAAVSAAVIFPAAHSHRQIFPTAAVNPNPPSSRKRKTDFSFKSDKRNDSSKHKDQILKHGFRPLGHLDMKSENRLKNNRKFYNRKSKNSEIRYAPFAPRNTTSFLIHSKKSKGGENIIINSSNNNNVTPPPCPVTPAVLPTPVLSPMSEFWIDMAKEEWGVDGYGSMKGLIRLRNNSFTDEEEYDNYSDSNTLCNVSASRSRNCLVWGQSGGSGSGSSDSDVEERFEVEKRLDHDVSRFEMVCPNFGNDVQASVLENRVDEQDCHISRLEEENMSLKEKLYFMERELEEMRRRVQCLESDGVWGNCKGKIGRNDVFSEQSVGNGNGEEEEDEENDNGGASSGKVSVH